jgi:hypothetical protein
MDSPFLPPRPSLPEPQFKTLLFHSGMNELGKVAIIIEYGS